MSDQSDQLGAGDLRVGTVVVNVLDLQRGIRFWCAALGYEPRDAPVGPRFAVLVDPAGRGVPVSVQLTDALPDGPNPVHLDLYTAQQQRQVERLMELGATRVRDWPYPDDADFVVLHDPDGNEFCMIDHVNGLTRGSK